MLLSWPLFVFCGRKSLNTTSALKGRAIQMGNDNNLIDIANQYQKANVYP